MKNRHKTRPSSPLSARLCHSMSATTPPRPPFSLCSHRNNFSSACRFAFLVSMVIISYDSTVPQASGNQRQHEVAPPWTHPFWGGMTATSPPQVKQIPKNAHSAMACPGLPGVHCIRWNGLSKHVELRQPTQHNACRHTGPHAAWPQKVKLGPVFHDPPGRFAC